MCKGGTFCSLTSGHLLKINIFFINCSLLFVSVLPYFKQALVQLLFQMHLDPSLLSNFEAISYFIQRKFSIMSCTIMLYTLNTQSVSETFLVSLLTTWGLTERKQPIHLLLSRFSLDLKQHTRSCSFSVFSQILALYAVTAL